MEKSKISKNDREFETLPELVRGHTYKHDEVVKLFKISSQGGMRKSNRTNSLVLFSKHSENTERNPYADFWQDGLLHYTGMGLTGDQSLNVAQNRTLNESATNGVDIHLFESSKKNQYTYRGKVRLAKEPYPLKEEDADGNPRRVYKFPLEIIHK